MTWHFGSPLSEQRLMSEGFGLSVLTDREVFEITGPDRHSWLHNLTTKSFVGVSRGDARSGLILDPNGRIKYVFHGVETGESFLAWTEPGMSGPLVDWLDKMRFMTQVATVQRPDLEVVWVGSKEEAQFNESPSRASEVGDGSEFFIPRETPIAATVGEWAFTALRIAAGIPQISIDTDELTIPNELGLYATDWGKGCYPGQETVAHVHNLGRIPRRLVLLNLDGAEERLPEFGSRIFAGDSEVGRVASSAYHFELGAIGLALIKRATPVDAVLSVDGIPAAQDALVDPDVGEHFKAPGLRRLL